MGKLSLDSGSPPKGEIRREVSDTPPAVSESGQETLTTWLVVNSFGDFVSLVLTLLEFNRGD